MRQAVGDGPWPTGMKSRLMDGWMDGRTDGFDVRFAPATRQWCLGSGIWLGYEAVYGFEFGELGKGNNRGPAT